uniref:Kelch repeat-containing F-box family protein n=1 Tax=Rhizophora mucronata TaxID=61149 RepID=A0A2P2ITW9_RHIMU
MESVLGSPHKSYRKSFASCRWNYVGTDVVHLSYTWNQPNLKLSPSRNIETRNICLKLVNAIPTLDSSIQSSYDGATAAGNI